MGTTRKIAKCTGLIEVWSAIDNIVNSISNISWGSINNKPDVFPPASHNHDSSYYLKTELGELTSEDANQLFAEVFLG